MSSRKIVDLQSHPEPYVTMSDLADYWRVSRKQIYKQIEAGTLKTTRLAPRLLRICTLDAIRFEDIAMTVPPSERETASHRGSNGDVVAAASEYSTVFEEGERQRRTH